MAVFPTTPRPRTATPLPFERRVIRSQFDGGAIATRAKYLTRRATGLQLTYLEKFANYQVMLDFWDEVAGSALTFEFTYPYPHSVVQIAAGNPAVVTTQHPHGYQTGEQVVVTNNAVAPGGPNSITRITGTTFSLDGHNAGVTTPGGNVARYFPRMAFLEDTFGPHTAIMGQGPPSDNNAYVSFLINLEER